MRSMIVACNHPLSFVCTHGPLVSILFGTSIPTFFNFLVKMFLHLFHWFLLCVATYTVLTSSYSDPYNIVLSISDNC